MRELAGNSKYKKPNPAKDHAGLAALAGMLNAHAGVTAPRENLPTASPAVVRAPAPAVALEPTQAFSTQQTPATPQTAGEAIPGVVPSLRRVFLTGRLKSGKDFLAEQAGCKIFALADPLYALAEYFFGKQPKDAARTFLQTVGQWGRGTISAEYPLTPERAMFIKMIRAAFSAGSDFHVDWSSYGRNENIWLDALIARAAEEPAEMKIAVSGVRFENELRRLTTEGFIHRHVLCSAATWADRLKKVGMTPESPACRDVSEHLAAAFDADVTRKLSQQKAGAKLAAVWCDERVSSPSTRLLTVAEFVAQFPR